MDVHIYSWLQLRPTPAARERVPCVGTMRARGIYTRSSLWLALSLTEERGRPGCVPWLRLEPDPGPPSRNGASATTSRVQLLGASIFLKNKQG